MNRYTLIGCSVFKAERTFAVNFINICAYMGIPCRDQVFSGDAFFCTVPVWYEGRLSALLQGNEVAFEVVGRKGLIPYASRYRKRYGLWIGAIIFFVMMVSAPRYLWHIDIRGNTYLRDEEVIESLRSAGLFLGAYLPDINVDKIESSTLAADGRITWISVNMSGTVAYVELRERTDRDIAERRLPYANVVASHDAIITEIEVYSGSASVKPDTFVRAGDLLISGIIERETIGTHLTYASGRVIGRVFEDYEIEIPYEYTVMENTGRRKQTIRVRFFDGSFSLGDSCSAFDSCEESVHIYAISEKEKRIPVFLERIVHNEQASSVRRRLPAQAKAEAYSALAKTLERDFPEGELISKETKIEYKDDSLVLRCSVCYEVDIGRVSEFEASE